MSTSFSESETYIRSTGTIPDRYSRFDREFRLQVDSAINVNKVRCSLN
jgi:hypothetical protein